MCCAKVVLAEVLPAAWVLQALSWDPVWKTLTAEEKVALQVGGWVGACLAMCTLLVFMQQGQCR